VVAVGGGGLISGVATAASALRPGIEVYGVQTERFPAVWNALHGGQRVCGQATIADGIGVQSPGALTLPLIRQRVKDVLLVDEVARVLPVVDLGTAEWVWQRAGRPTLDLTEGAAKELGGQPVYQGGKLTGLKGLDNLQFSVVSVDAER
jgi:hypothetical protein